MESTSDFHLAAAHQKEVFSAKSYFNSYLLT